MLHFPVNCVTLNRIAEQNKIQQKLSTKPHEATLNLAPDFVSCACDLVDNLLTLFYCTIRYNLDVEDLESSAMSEPERLAKHRKYVATLLR